MAKSLEIKELCNAETELNDEPPTCDPVTSTKNVEEETIISDQMKMHAPKEIHKKGVKIETVHQGFKYACDQCDYEATQNSGKI